MMTMTKFADAESAEVLPPVEEARINEELRRIGKTSAKDLTEVERKEILTQPE